MPIGEFQELRAIDVIRQNLQRLVSLLRETQTTQGVDQPRSAVRHRHHGTRRQTSVLLVIAILSAIAVGAGAFAYPVSRYRRKDTAFANRGR
jgi:hypothetical protein